MKKDYLKAYSEFIHQSQLERGIVSLYQQEKDGSLNSMLEHQFEAVDQSAKILGDISDQQNGRLKPFLEAVTSLTTKREGILSHLVKPSTSFLYYSYGIIDPALEILSEMAVLDDGNDPARINAYINFLRWKEHVGLERALGIQIIVLGDAVDHELAGRLHHIIGQQNAYKRMFLTLATAEDKIELNKAVRLTPAFAKIEELHQSLTPEGYEQLINCMPAMQWFDLFTAKINAMHQLSQFMAAKLPHSAIEYNATEPSQPTQSYTASDPKVYWHSIRSFPLFAGTPDAVLQELLARAGLSSN